MPAVTVARAEAARLTMLLPISSVEMSMSRWLKNTLMMRFTSPLFAMSMLARTLLAETKAISIPEKNPENSSDTSMIISEVMQFGCY